MKTAFLADKFRRKFIVTWIKIGLEKLRTCSISLAPTESIRRLTRSYSIGAKQNVGARYYFLASFKVFDDI